MAYQRLDVGLGRPRHPRMEHRPRTNEPDMPHLFAKPYNGKTLPRRATKTYGISSRGATDKNWPQPFVGSSVVLYAVLSSNSLVCHFDIWLRNFKLIGVSHGQFQISSSVVPDVAYISGDAWHFINRVRIDFQIQPKTLLLHLNTHYIL